jgi:hypothetical protein
MDILLVLNSFQIVAIMAALGSLAVTALNAVVPEFRAWWDSHDDAWKQSRFIYVGFAFAGVLAGYGVWQGAVSVDLAGLKDFLLKLGSFVGVANITHQSTKRIGQRLAKSKSG